MSLTKHGAHKIAALLKQFNKDQILQNLSGSLSGVNIEMAQARKNLSVTADSVVPDLWNEVRELGNSAIDSLVLIAIIFTHHKLISIMRQSTDRREFLGTITRTQFDNEKAFTNFAHIIDELGYSVEHTLDHVRYDFQNLFKISGLYTLVVKLLTLKLVAAGWDRKNSVTEESTFLGFHEVFSLSKEQFCAWLTTGNHNISATQWSSPGDEEFFFEPDDEGPISEFLFKPGHTPKKTGSVSVNASDKSTSLLLHNQLQNMLFENLVKQYGENCVGTEVSTGNGTSIDIVVKTDRFCWFYEIKTASSVKACIRQAIPQLLEYAYWHGSNDKADRLIIVSPKKITYQAEVYLGFLRSQFRLPIYYEQLPVPTLN